MEEINRIDGKVILLTEHCKKILAKSIDTIDSSVCGKYTLREGCEIAYNTKDMLMSIFNNKPIEVDVSIEVDDCEDTSLDNVNPKVEGAVIPTSNVIRKEYPRGFDTVVWLIERYDKPRLYITLSERMPQLREKWVIYYEKVVAACENYGVKHVHPYILSQLVAAYGYGNITDEKLNEFCEVFGGKSDGANRLEPVVNLIKKSVEDIKKPVEASLVTRSVGLHKAGHGISSFIDGVVVPSLDGKPIQYFYRNKREEKAKTGEIIANIQREGDARWEAGREERVRKNKENAQKERELLEQARSVAPTVEANNDDATP